MKAVVLNSVGENFAVEEVATPTPAKGEVLVKIHAAAFNHRDLWIQKGQYAGLKFPIILGSDGSGVVAAVGEGVGANLVGTAVVINPSLHWGDDARAQSKHYKILGLPDNGTFADFVCVPAENVAPKPAHLSFAEAAALPLAGLTAYRALFTRATATRQDVVLVSGVGGGVALFAMQFALAMGAKVFVTSGSDEKIERAMQLGASGGVNYKAENFHKQLIEKSGGGFDVIVDSAAGEGFNFLIDAAKPAARIVFYGGTNGNFQNLSPQKIFWKQLSLFGSTMGSSEEFAQMTSFVAAHSIKPVVDSVFPFAEAQSAIARMQHKAQFGKIVLSFDENNSL